MASLCECSQLGVNPTKGLCYTGNIMAGASDELTEIPLFPLNLVLFPGMPLPLHIFEERYKAMIGDCMRYNTPFGVSLIRSGQEVGSPADPQPIGTTTRVLRSQMLEEGRLNIMTKGERRFEVIEITQREPHVAALVKLLDETVGEGFTGISSELTEEFTRMMRSLISLGGGYTSQVDVPENPVELSYMIAAKPGSANPGAPGTAGSPDRCRPAEPPHPSAQAPQPRAPGRATAPETRSRARG